MTRFGLLIAVSALLILSFSHPGHDAYAQSRSSGTDIIRFVGAKTGVGQGEPWCWLTQPSNSNNGGWHGWWVSDTYISVPGSGTGEAQGNALDEVSQTGPFVPGAAFTTYCPSIDAQGNPVAPNVEFRVYGKTDNTQCTMANPCPSLRVKGTSGKYNVGPACTYIHADLYVIGQ